MNKRNPFQLFVVIGSLFTLILGRLTWNTPPWLNYFRRKAAARPALFWGLILLILISAFGYHWYKKLPRPHLVTTYITAPQITPVSKVLVPDVLTIDFGIHDNGFMPKSVAPIKLIGKDIPKGITLTPNIPGKWVWQSDNRLIFTPSQDWPAGEDYTIHFEKAVFAAGTKMESYSYSFSTQPFAASIAEFKFYQDPVNAQLRQAIATINFNFPVDTNSFENKTLLQLQALKSSQLDLNSQRFKYTITYDEHKRTAYLHSEPLPLPEVPRYLQLLIDKGIKPISGNPSTAVVTKNVLIPDAGSYFKVTHADATIVRNEQDKPEQVLSIETTIGVKDTELTKSLHVYLLPQDYPATATEDAKTNYQWQNPGEVTPDILKLSTAVELQAIPADRDYATLHSYKFSAQTPRYIYIKLDKGIKSFGNYSLAESYTALAKVPEYPKEIGFLHKGSLLALSGEQKLSVIVRGLPAVKFQIARVLPDDVNQLVTQTEGKFSHPRFVHDSFNQQNISEIFSEIQQFDDTDLAKGQYTALNIGKYLSAKTNTAGPRGLFLLHAVGWDIAKKTALDTKADRLILITDLGLLVKDNNDSSHDVFVQSITAGTPVAKADVSILGKNGLPVLTRTTDASGRAHFPTLSDFTDEREPTVYLAKLGNDVAFIPFNNSDRQLNYSRFDIGGVYNYDQELQTLTAYLFSDRGIYRPNDTAHIGMIVKRAYAQSQPAGLPLEVMITDPRGTTVLDQKLTLDATGYFSFDFHPSATAPTGQYSVSLFIVHDNHPSNLLGSTTIRVAEFLPDRMRITSHLSQPETKGWIMPTELSAKVSLMNLYGAPAANRKISAKILLAPQRVQFSDYPNYTFFDPLFDPNKPAKVFTDTLPDTQTNDQGQAQFALNLGRFDKATYQLTVFTEGFESEGGRSVATQTTALVSPLTYLIGYKADGDLSFIKQNAQRSVNFIAVNPQLKQIPISNLKIQVIALQPVTTLVKNADGTYQYQSVIQSNVVSTTPFTVNAEVTPYALATQQIGNFAVVILDQSNTELSRFKYSVVGTSQLPLAKNAELSVKLNKTEYAPGEDIELQITAPYTGAGLITIERDNVYATQWFKTDTTNSVQKIHIPNDFQGNGYVNVAFVRDWNSPEIFISPLSFSIAPFNVNHENHAIHIDLTTPDLARPGEPFNIEYKSDKSGKIIVFAVDEGILQVANYKTPDPLGFFFQKRALQVITQQTVDQILPKFMQDRELSAVGGDGGEEELKNNLNPFKRKTELPVVYWSGIIDTDTTPRQLVYQVPDYFNGTLRVMAVAVASDAVGSTDKSSQIRGNFVINPNVPTFVAPGDEFEITASVANNVKGSGKDAKTEVRLDVTPQLQIIGAATQTLSISEGQEQTAHFKLKAKSLLGSAQMTLTANIGDKLSKMSSTLSVRPASAFETSVTSGNATTATKSLPLNRVLYPEFRQVDAVISSSPLILVYGLQRYLDNFPYGCTEQLVSKAFPLLALGSQSWLNNDPRQVTEKIEMSIQAISQRQMSSGGFSYWPGFGENTSNTFASVYAMHFLTEARHSYNVPNDVFHAGLGYLKDLAAENPTSLEQARIQAYAIYILTRNEIVTTNYLTNLLLYLEKDPKHAWQQDITSAYIAATYQLLKSYSDADRIIAYYKPENHTAQVSDFYNDSIADAQYLYLIARHFPDRLPKVSDTLIASLISAIDSDSINTVLSGYSSLALSAYAQSYQTSNTGTFFISEKFADGKLKNLSAIDNTYVKVNIDNLAKEVTFNNPAKQNYFYQLTQAGFDKIISTEAMKDGLEVYREYRDTNGNVVNQAKLGSEIEVHIQIRALDDRYFNNIVIVDLLPGGFEVVRDSINHSNMDYADTREDRVVFFGNATPNSKEIVYRIKAINAGHYAIPPIIASSMYDPKIKSRGLSGNMVVD